MYGVNQSSVDEAIYCKARKLEFVLCMIFCFKNNSFSHNFSKVFSKVEFLFLYKGKGQVHVLLPERIKLT